jgi:hypothetical protein
MKWEALKEIADADSIETKVNHDTGIVAVDFTINGGRCHAQFSAGGGSGVLYAFTFFDGASLLAALGRDEKGKLSASPLHFDPDASDAETDDA